MKKQKKYGMVIILGVAAIAIMAETILLIEMGKPVREILLVLGLVTATGLFRLLFPFLMN